MFSATRRRETIYGEYILKYHPDYAPGLPFYYRREYPFAIEGGDVLNLSAEVLAVGLSQRTSPEAVEMLAEHVFADPESSLRTILALDIPNIRAFMHLDTVCTQVDYDKFVVHPGILKTLKIYEIRAAGSDLAVRELDRPLEEVFAEYLGLDHVTLIRCGGNDRIVSEREQWNDGSNTLCIAPGKVVTCDRNYITNDLLTKHGLEVLTVTLSELSRGKGGPRCMTCPVAREDI
jgi:arginine deiminase